MEAASSGNLEAMKVLMMAQANVDVADSIGETALFYCLRASSIAERKTMMRLLCLNGANVNQVNSSGVD